MITVITPTGDRHFAFRLCRLWMMLQTIEPFQWIVVDDGKVPYHSEDLPDYCDYIRREPTKKDGEYTLVQNLKTAVPLILGDRIIIMEDDDYYAPNYIETIVRMLDNANLVGLNFVKYYHIAQQLYRTITNNDYAPLCLTGFNRNTLEDFITELDKDEVHMFDLRFWHNTNAKKLLISDNDIHVGIKGLPGRKGIGKGHDPNFNNYIFDKDYKVFKEWIPLHYHNYIRLYFGETK